MSPILPKAIADALQANVSSTSRRNFLKASGALVISLGVFPDDIAFAAAADGGPYVDPDFRQLDTWIVIHPDNTATFFVGKTDGGQGTGTAFRQMMCDELDIPYDKTSLIMGRTDTTPDQGGSGGSDAIERDGWPMRRVAAEARRALLELAGKHFGVPAAQLEVKDATIVLKADPSKSVTYAELVGGKPGYRQGDPQPLVPEVFDIVRRVALGGGLGRALNEGPRMFEAQEERAVEKDRPVHPKPLTEATSSASGSALERRPS